MHITNKAESVSCMSYSLHRKHMAMFPGKQFISAMLYQKNGPVVPAVLLILLFIACNNTTGKMKDKELVKDPGSINHYIRKNIQEALRLATAQNGRVDDSLHLDFHAVVEEYYYGNEYSPIWSDTGAWHPFAKELQAYLDTAALDGLYKEDYHFSDIVRIKKMLDTDAVKRTDAVLWTKADLLLTDAFMHIICDLKQGRLQTDSNSWKNDTTTYHTFFSATFNRFLKGEPLSDLLRSLQPANRGYAALKKGIRKFIDSMDNRKYTYLNYPYKKNDPEDSSLFIHQLQLRLSESGMLKYNRDKPADSIQLATAISAYQKKRKLAADGKISAGLIRLLNLTDRERFNRIAITLDRYKQLPDSLPEKYIWVNLPGFYLQLWDHDSLALASKIICGKPATPTPFITSAITDIIIYPTWTVPESIIKKEMLPGLKKNAGYLARKGLDLYNYQGDLVDPSTVNWSKYSKGIPYKIQQGSGDGNALGVIKFNFDNPHFVYMHDTNQRYLFKNSVRALSHGCVRVQEWQQLAFYIARNDSLNLSAGDSLKYNQDSITNWIANKEKHRIQVKNKIPLFFRYFSCEGNNGAIKFYEDIYGDDKRLKEKYFAGK